MPYRILYASRVAADAASRLPSTMEDVLIISAAWNLRDNITGFLFSDGISFTQVLEGEEPEVEACFGRIRRDPRHRDVTPKFRGPVEARAFPRWSMCGLYLSALDDALVDEVDAPTDLVPADLDALLQLLKGLAARHGPALDRMHAELLERKPD
jgi:hypothetical protein